MQRTAACLSRFAHVGSGCEGEVNEPYGGGGQVPWGEGLEVLVEVVDEAEGAVGAAEGVEMIFGIVHLFEGEGVVVGV